MRKAVLATNQKKQKDDKSKAPFHKVKKENLKNQRPRKKSAKLADKEVRVKISTGELQQVSLFVLVVYSFLNYTRPGVDKVKPKRWFKYSL